MNIILSLRLLKETQRQLALADHRVYWPLRHLGSDDPIWIVEPRSLHGRAEAWVAFVSEGSARASSALTTDGCTLPAPISQVEVDALGRWRGRWWPPYWHQWLGPQALASVRVAGVSVKQAGLWPREAAPQHQHRRRQWRVLLAGDAYVCEGVVAALNSSRRNKMAQGIAARPLGDQLEQLRARDCLVWLGGDERDRRRWLEAANLVDRPVLQLQPQPNMGRRHTATWRLRWESLAEPEGEALDAGFEATPSATTRAATRISGIQVDGLAEALVFLLDRAFSGKDPAELLLQAAPGEPLRWRLLRSPSRAP